MGVTMVSLRVLWLSAGLTSGSLVVTTTVLVRIPPTTAVSLTRTRTLPITISEGLSGTCRSQTTCPPVVMAVVKPVGGVSET